MKLTPANIIISRTDSIGDVVLTLPLAAVLKQHFPQARIAFIGRAYTRPVIEACKYVDAFIDKEAFLHGPVTVCGQTPDTILHVLPDAAIAFRARQLGIRRRVGTTNRLYHWVTCNRLVLLGRRRSQLHEAQLNLKLLKAFGIDSFFSLQEIGLLYGLERLKPLPPAMAGLIAKNKYNLILHPKSQGNGREWGLNNFIQLIRLLDNNHYQVFISGTQKERLLIQPLFDAAGHKVTDITGMMSLDEFITFIAGCDGLVASGTGPLHLAAALGKDAMGIFPPIRPVHPGRWAPLGPQARVFVINKSCSDCRDNDSACHCIADVSPLLVKEALDKQQIKTR
ncbi:MAG TPA: glycosyltransferase family 9 protein [Chitinophagaceae bacterium]|nr:glycosyltransferase family 9 protein [Chitinophagaceae bacterium]